jgi:hypothetical protein
MKRCLEPWIARVTNFVPIVSLSANIHLIIIRVLTTPITAAALIAASSLIVHILNSTNKTIPTTYFYPYSCLHSNS